MEPERGKKHKGRRRSEKKEQENTETRNLLDTTCLSQDLQELRTPEREDSLIDKSSRRIQGRRRDRDSSRLSLGLQVGRWTDPPSYSGMRRGGESIPTSQTQPRKRNKTSAAAETEWHPNRELESGVSAKILLDN